MHRNYVLSMYPMQFISALEEPSDWILLLARHYINIHIIVNRDTDKERHNGCGFQRVPKEKQFWRPELFNFSMAVNHSKPHSPLEQTAIN